MSHTKEPWSVADHNKSIVICFQGEQTLQGTTPYFAGGGALESEREANARRIVACVNACRGISNADLEMDNAAFINVFNERAEYKQRCEELQNQRDELLARIEVVCEVQIVSPAYDRIRAEKVFAIDDLEYDLFAAGWKAAIDTVKGGA